MYKKDPKYNEKLNKIFDDDLIHRIYDDLCIKERFDIKKLVKIYTNYSINICELLCETFESHKNLFILENIVNAPFSSFNVDFTKINNTYHAVIRRETINKDCNDGRLIFKRPCKIYVNEFNVIFIKTYHYGNIYFV